MPRAVPVSRTVPKLSVEHRKAAEAKEWNRSLDLETKIAIKSGLRPKSGGEDGWDELHHQREIPRGRDDEVQLTADVIEQARQYGRYGYRKIAALLRRAGWLVNDKRIGRIGRREGLKVPARQTQARSPMVG